MGVSTEKAYEILNLPIGSSKDAIEQSYKRLAVKWHPEKYTGAKHTHDALKKFKLISLAYRKLTLNERDVTDITLREMFDQYRQVFHGDKKSRQAGPVDDTKPIDKNNNSNGSSTSSAGKSGGGVQLQEINNNINKNGHRTNPQHRLPLQTNGHHHHHFHFNSNSNNEENHENQFQSYRKHDDHIADANMKMTLKQMAKMCAIKGNELAMQEEYAKAIEKFTEAIKYDQNDHRLYGNRSFCLDKLNLYQEAIDDAEKAIRLEPAWPKGYYRKGRALYGLKMYKEAEEAFMKLLEFDDINEPELEEELMEVRVLQLQEMGFSKVQSEAAVKSHGSVSGALESMLLIGSQYKASGSISDMEDELNVDDSESCDTNSEYDQKSGRRGTEFNSGNQSDDSSDFKLVAPSSKRNNTKGTGSSHSNDQHHHQEKQPPVSTSLWVGNVDPDVTQQEITEMFAAFGTLTNVRCLPEKYCAFINFKHKEDAAKAMQTLQGKALEGQRLLIKYPDNPVTNIVNSSSSSSSVFKPAIILGKAASQKNNAEPTRKQAKKVAAAAAAAHVDTTTSSDSKNSDQSKLTGPVNGNECYFWRTTGCIYADKCRYDHIKKHKGIDKKPWHKQ